MKPTAIEKEQLAYYRAFRRAVIHNENCIYKRLIKLEKQMRDALKLASTHDPDHDTRIAILERQAERLGAPKYRKGR